MNKIDKLDKEAVRAKYLSGKSCLDCGLIFNVSASTIAKIVKDIARPKGYPRRRTL